MKHDINQIIADNIRKVRIIKEVDTKSIAEYLGISSSAYTKMERGEIQIDIERIVSISEKLGVSPMDILSFSSNNIFEKIEIPNIVTLPNIDTESQYSVPKEIIDSLTSQLKIKDEQLKSKDEQLMQLQLLMQKLIER